MKLFTLDYLDHNQQEKITKHLYADKPLKCHHKKCDSFNVEFFTLYEYNVHCHTNHPRQPLHPELSFIELLGLEPRGNPWEDNTSSITFVNTKTIIEQALGFLLWHFNQERLFPRTIQTAKSKGSQIEVFSKEEALKHYEESDYIDCRINAFPSYTEYKGIQRYPPDFIFIDLDRSSFKDNKQLERALFKTLKNIRETLNGGHPTVNNSGNGYHIIQPIDCPILEQIPEFEKYYDKFSVSQEFIRFAEITLSNGKADPSHHPSFKSCQIRVPNSINKKCLDNREKRLEGYKVQTVQSWNGIRAHIPRELIEDFRTYLEQKIVDEEQEQKGFQPMLASPDANTNNDSIDWIEKLHQIPIDDYRKKAIDLIFVPYFILVKKYSNEETTSKINEWLDNCNSIRQLDFNPKDRIKAAIKNTLKKQIFPMKKDTLKNHYQYLYSILQNKGANLNEYIQFR